VCLCCGRGERTALGRSAGKTWHRRVSLLLEINNDRIADVLVHSHTYSSILVMQTYFLASERKHPVRLPIVLYQVVPADEATRIVV
jgi:hypothetical protein